MTFRGNLFTKLNAGLAVVFLLIVLVYAFAHQKTTETLQNEIQESNLQKLFLLTGDMEYKIQQMESFSMILLADPAVKQYGSIPLERLSYDQMVIRRSIQNKITFQESVSTQWRSTYAVYSMYNGDMLASNPAEYDKQYLERHLSVKWALRNNERAGGERHFYKYVADAIIQPGDPKDASIIIETSFPESNIRLVLDEAKGKGRGDPFLFQPGGGTILNSSSDAELTPSILEDLGGRELGDSFRYVTRLHGSLYAVTGVRSGNLNWYMVDYVPLSRVMVPLVSVNRIFYLVLVLLFGLTLSLSFVLHRNVLRPLKLLLGGLQSVKRGDYSVRLMWNSRDEFRFVFERFNEMTKQIKELIEHVLLEQLRAKDAVLKQLQAQINPHFLYNCLGFIINMTEMKQHQAVVSMAHNLGEYYRYTTRSDLESVTIGDELEMIRHYLHIQQMRFPRLEFELSVPETMYGLRIPRLLLQPVVENAIVHSVGTSLRPARIWVTGCEEEGAVRIRLEDNGRGMTGAELEQLRESLQAPDHPPIGYGLWNIAQRMRHIYRGGAAFTIGPSDRGGVCVEFIWRKEAFDEFSKPKGMEL